MKKIIVPLALAALICGTASAQSQRGRFQVGIAFEPFFPQGEFRDAMDRIGWGGSLDAFYRIPGSALLIGTTLAYHVYGHDSRWEPLSWSIPDVMVKVSTTNAVARGHFLLRLQPQFGSARPYIEGLVGVLHLTTDTRVYDDYDYGDNEIASTNQLNSTVLSYGMGGGLVLNLSRRPRANPNRGFAVLLDIGVRYLRGGTADYLTPGDIEIQGGTVSYFVNRSRTDILIPRIGVTFAF
jgi:hypothetical protein